ncbi:FAD-binding oxidoreductase [Shinella zoogloeoides]
MSDLLLRELAAVRFDCALVTAGHPAFEKQRLVWNGLIDRRPAAIVRPRSSEDIRKAVGVVASAKAPLAVRCGGHSFPGFSTCDGGLVVDLSEMNSVSLDTRSGTADVEGGALLGDLDRATVAHGLVVPAGVISHTGVGGLTLGGGMGWLSRRYGLTIDSLLGAEIVTADGAVVWASETSERDLFWGIRGGGGNFGIVSRFRFRLHPLGSTVVGKWEYSLSAARPALERLRAIAGDLPRDLTFSLTLTRTGLTVTAVWFGGEAIAEKALSPFASLTRGGEGRIEIASFLDLQSRNDKHFAWSRRYYSKGGFWTAITDEAIERAIEGIARAPTPDCEIYAIRLGGAVCDVDDAATAYSGRKADYYWIAEPVWDDPADDARCLAWGREAAGHLASKAIAGNYVNEQGDDDPSVAQLAYGPGKYERLARLKARFDPTNLFRLNQNIVPAA